MVKPLSEQLAELSVYAKQAEDSVAATRNETREKIVALRDQSRSAASAAIEKVDSGVKSVGDSAARGWSALQAKISANMNALKAGIEQKKHDRTVRRAEDNAAWLEDEAALAIGYAIASIEEARLAVLDAIVGKLDAEAARRS
jgi:hypothetical protein